jgi:hypothetical protein
MPCLRRWHPMAAGRVQPGCPPHLGPLAPAPRVPTRRRTRPRPPRPPRGSGAAWRPECGPAAGPSRPPDKRSGGPGRPGCRARRPGWRPCRRWRPDGRAASSWPGRAAGWPPAATAGNPSPKQPTQPDHHPAGLGVERVAEHRSHPSLLVFGGEPRPQAVNQRPSLLLQPRPGVDQVLAATPQRAQRTCRRGVQVHQRALPAGQQPTDPSRVQPVGLAPAVPLLFAHRRHLPGVEQPYHQPVTIAQVGDQRLVMVASGLDADHHPLGAELSPRGGD